MDAAAESLVPPRPEGLRGPVVIIDHHAVHDDYGDMILREPDACATGLVVIRAMRELGLSKIPKGAARPLYAAIVADTGGFRYGSTTPETHRVAAELLELGADPWLTASHIFERWEPPRMKLLAELLGEMTLELDHQLAVLKVSQETMARAGADEQMVEGMVNYGRMLESVEIAALLWEQSDGTTKLSLRASRDVDVAVLAREFGGGGHRAAAGARCRDGLETVHEQVRILAASLLERR
jgi:phosphoesterase RecJ-like protein